MVVVALAAFVLAIPPLPLPYLNPALTPEARAADLVSRMTLIEKIGQMQHVAPAIPRLGIPAYNWWSEALHGAVGDPVTVYPQAIGLAASFDPGLLGQVATGISDEARARYALVKSRGNGTGMHEGLDFWAPNINIFRDPRWGRGQETYGEDPFLTSTMAVAFVRNLQGEQGGKYKAIATPKHFAVHSGPDPERHRFNAVVDPRDMWNTYLPGFRAAITIGGARSIMSAYSAVNGEPDSASPTLLKKILRGDWGFKGYVVSDCGAIYDIFNGHHKGRSLAEADAMAVNAGCDLECGDAYQALKDAVAKDYITPATIDRSLRRLFEARIRLGMFDPPASSGPWAVLPPSTIDSSAHKQLALRAARESIVLLKNDGILPLKNVRTLAVIGPNADSTGVPLGNYNGTPSHTVSVLEGIRAIAPTVTTKFVQGSPRLNGRQGTPIPAENLPGGVDGEYFRGETLAGAPIYRRHTYQLDFDWGGGSPSALVPNDGFSARWTATLVPKTTGDYELGTTTDDGSRLWLDDRLIVDDWNIHPARPTTTSIHLVGGQAYRLRMEYFEHDGNASASLVWAPPTGHNYDEAVKLAKEADAVVLVLGLSGELENEENDRRDIDLPAPQKGLLKAVLDTGRPVVVVLESGSCLTVDDPRIRGIVQAWYPGEQGGTAVAETLFGRINPGGRLPVTFYRSLAQVPAFRDYKMEGRTYRYLHVTPLYPFGYGLSYTKFAYAPPYRPYAMVKYPDAKLGKPHWVEASGSRTSGDVPGTQLISATLSNVGPREGDEVVQVYASRDGAKWPEPARRLVAFERVHLRAGQTEQIHLVVDPRALAQADGEGNLTILPGHYRFAIGGGIPGREPTTSGRAVVVGVNLPKITVGR